MDELLEQLRVKIESRNAIDWLQFVVENWDGTLGQWLMARQMMNDHGDRCPECDAGDEFPDQIQ